MASGSDSKYGLILLGNSGVGKSFLGNVILGRDVFEHECSSTSVTHETEFQDYAVGNASYAVFNIPGLIEADQAALDRNKVEIYKAFQQRPNSVVAFVFTGGSGGRIRDEDILAFEAINAAYSFQPESLLLIVNDLPRSRSPEYEGKTSIKLEKVLQIPNVRVCFLDRINKIEDVFGIRRLVQRSPEQEEREQMRRKLFDGIIQCTPHVYEKHGDIKLTVDKVKELTEEYQQKQLYFEQEVTRYKQGIEQRQKQFDELERQLKEKPREIHHYHENVIERGGGCTLS